MLSRAFVQAGAITDLLGESMSRWCRRTVSSAGFLQDVPRALIGHASGSPGRYRRFANSVGVHARARPCDSAW